MSDDGVTPVFGYEDLWFVKLISATDKNPLEKWGGYSQEDYAGAENVYNHEQVVESDHEYWGIVGIQGDRSLLIFDLDVHKASDGFDPDSVEIPDNTTIARSQNGGLHCYFVTDHDRGAGKESAFEMQYDLGWDIDIRGSYVSHHVVAPADIPGVGGKYAIVNDAPMLTVFDPADAAERVRYLGDGESEKAHGEALLTHRAGGGYGGSIAVDRDVEPPAEMPTCYHRGLQIRAANPDDPNVNTHKVNTLTALCGLAAGYSINEMVQHFCEEFAPGANADERQTRYQLETMARKMDRDNLAPPSIRTLREYGILEADEGCDCQIDYHGDRASESRDHVAVLPPAVRELTSATTGWDWRHAARDGQRDLTIDDARDRTTAAIADAYERFDHSLVEALPTMGKSYGAVKAAAETGEQISFLTGRGHKEQYQQIREWCDEHGLDHYTLPSFTRDCETANGEHGREWADRVRSWYHRGATPKEIHKAAEYVLGHPLPCHEHGCTYSAKWDFDPDDYDVLIGHYTHAHQSKVTSGRAVVIDEFPGGAYETELGFELQGAVSCWLAKTAGVPFEDYTDLIENRDDQARRADALLWFENRGTDVDQGHVFDDPKAHASAPLAVFTLLAGEDLGNGVEKASVGDGGQSVFDRERGVMTVLRPPELDYARSVVALDGTPTREMWDLALGTRFNHRQVLAETERAEYIENALNVNLVRTTDAVKPYNSADHVTSDQDGALLEAIRERHGRPASVITTATAEGEYDADGVLDNGLIEETKHFGNVLGSNEFDDTRVGAVIGSNHYGDQFLKKWGAYSGKVVERNDEKGAALSYGAFGDRILAHMRDHETLQAALRFGRDGNGAVVYVHTDTLPEWVPVAGVGRVIRTRARGERQLLDALGESGWTDWRTADLAEHSDVSLSERQIRTHLHRLAEEGHLDVSVENGGYVWRDDGLHRIGDHGEVELDAIDLDELGEHEAAEVARSSSYTWSFRSSPGDPSDPVDSSDSLTSSQPTVDETGVSSGNPPPR